MGKFIMVSFAFVLMLGVVYASGSWGDISGRNNSNISSANVSVSENISFVKNKSESPVDQPIVSKNFSHSDGAQLNSGGKEYTINFYIALGLLLLVLFLVLLFLYLFIRSPKNKWK